MFNNSMAGHIGKFDLVILLWDFVNNNKFYLHQRISKFYITKYINDC